MPRKKFNSALWILKNPHQILNIRKEIKLRLNNNRMSPWNKEMGCFFKKTFKNDKPLARLFKEKRELKIRNERG